MKLSGIALSLSVIILGAVRSESEIWVVVRLGRLLALPIIWLFGVEMIGYIQCHRRVRMGVFIFFGGTILTQFGFAYYATELFPNGGF